MTMSWKTINIDFVKNAQVYSLKLATFNIVIIRLSSF